MFLCAQFPLKYFVSFFPNIFIMLMWPYWPLHITERGACPPPRSASVSVRTSGSTHYRSFRRLLFLDHCSRFCAFLRYFFCVGGVRTIALEVADGSVDGWMDVYSACATGCLQKPRAGGRLQRGGGHRCRGGVGM